MSIPGYVDIQINGYHNVDFSDPELTESDFLRTAERIFESGTYLFLPTVITGSEEVYLRNIKLMHDAVVKNGLEKQIPGIHWEGRSFRISPVPSAATIRRISGSRTAVFSIRSWTIPADSSN